MHLPKFWKKREKGEGSGKGKYSQPQDAVPPEKASSGAVQLTEAQASHADTPAKPGPKTGEQLSNEIWNQAYDDIEKHQKELIVSYMKALTIYLRDEQIEAGATEPAENIDVSAQLNDLSEREKYLRDVVRKGNDRIVTTVKVSRVVGGIADSILAAKPVIDLVTTIPQAAPAAIPWAGACVGLQILANPKRSINANLSGIADVTSKMEWYYGLVEHILSTTMTDSAEISLEDVRKTLRQKVIELYKLILVFQMKSACSYYRHQGYNFLLQLWNADDWTEALKSINSAEEEVLNKWEKYDRAKAQKVREELVNLTSKIESRLGSIHQTLENFIKQQEQTRLEEETEECLSDLRVVYPLDDMNRIEKEKECLIDDIYNWILNDEKYTALTNWEDPNSPQCQLLWIKGDAGTGKTMLLIGIIRDLSQKLAILTPSLSYFFFQSQGKSDESLDNAAAGLKTLMWMLLIQQPHLISHLQSDYRRSHKKHFMGKNAAEAMLRNLTDMLQDARPVYFAVDALDECDKEIDRVVEFIATSLAFSTKFRWLVSSRPETGLIEKLNTKLKTLEGDHSKAMRSLLSLDVCDQKDRVEMYIQIKLDGLRNSPNLDIRESYTEDENILNTVSLEVRKRADNNMLWVSLVFQDLGRMHGEYALKAIKEYPSGLPELYDHKLSMIENHKEPRHTRKGPSYLTCCRDLLIVTSHTYRPLSFSELRTLIPWAKEIDTNQYVEDCSAFLSIRDKIVTLNHKSAKDYLITNHKRLQGGTIQSHADIARQSIEVMKQNLGRNMYNLDQYGIVSKDNKRNGSSPLASIAYSCVFWVEHLCFDKDGDPRQLVEGSEDVQVLEFLKERFLNWLESLTLLGTVLDGIMSIKKLLRSTQPNKSPQLAEFLKDAEKFLLTNGWIIDKAPLQIYGSALIFSPKLSQIRAQFWKDRWPFIKDVNGVKEHWDALRQTLQTDTRNNICSLAFSPNSTTLASVSHDGTLNLWDAVTGAQKWMWHSPNSTKGIVVFSPDSTTVFCSQDKSTRETSTGTIKKTFEASGHWDSVVFSSNGRSLVSVSGDDVQLWDVDTATGQQAFKCSGSLFCLSQDGTLLASVDKSLEESYKNDKNIIIRDAHTGIIKHTLRGHVMEIKGLTFCTKLNCACKLLATASSDSSVKIWDTNSGKIKHTIEHDFESTPNMAFSPDNRTIAVAFRAETWIYDYVGGIHTHTLWIEYGPITFSPDGKTLVLGSSGEIQLWDAADLNKEETLQKPTGKVIGGEFNPVILSPSCDTIASMSYDKIQLQDITKRSPKITVNAKGSLRQIVFSQDSTTLISTSYSTLQFWDIVHGTCRKTVDTGVLPTIISPNGTVVASSAHGGTITLWNTATLDQKEFQLGYPEIGLIAISPDSTKLASVKREKIEIWNIAEDQPSSIFDLAKNFNGCNSIAFSPDGKKIIWASDTKIEILDHTTNDTKEFGIQKPVKDRGALIGMLALASDCHALAFGWSLVTVKSGEVPHNVQVRDTTKFDIIRAFDLNFKFYELSLSNDGTVLNTNRGVLSLSDKTNYLRPPSNSTALFVQSEWIVNSSGPLLWIPLDYRGDGVNVFNSTILLENKWDDTLVIELENKSDK